MSKRKKSGPLAPAINCPPEFAGVLFDADIDWSEQPIAGPISEDTARELVKRLPASMVQAAVDATGAGGEVEAWRLVPRPQRRKEGTGTPLDIDWTGVFRGGKAPASDLEIARQYNISPNAVGNARRRLGVTQYNVQRGGKPSGPKYIDWDAQPLGNAPDSEIARQLNVSPESVKRARTMRQIKAFRVNDFLDWRIVVATDESDAALARRIGVTRTTIRKKRRELGLKSP